jgi:hypothetical protein
VDYIDFELEISAGPDQSFAVAVLRSPAGEPRDILQLPLDQRELENRLLALENAVLRSGAAPAVRHRNDRSVCAEISVRHQPKRASSFAEIHRCRPCANSSSVSVCSATRSTRFPNPRHEHSTTA